MRLYGTRPVLIILYPHAVLTKPHAGNVEYGLARFRPRRRRFRLAANPKAQGRLRGSGPFPRLEHGSFDGRLPSDRRAIPAAFTGGPCGTLVRRHHRKSFLKENRPQRILQLSGLWAVARCRQGSGQFDGDLLSLQRIDLTFGGDRETEHAVRQYVSGRTFGEFGLKPALGRLLTNSDDMAPGRIRTP